MERRKACFVISCIVLSCLLSIASIQGNIGRKVTALNDNSSIAPMSTYVGVVAGNEFQFNVTKLSPNFYLPKGGEWISIYSWLSNGTYKFVLTVDNVTVNGQSTTIGYHGVLSNSTDTSILTMHGNGCTVTINATDTTVTAFNYFINENIATKKYTQSPGVTAFDYELAKYDDSGVMTSLSEWLTYPNNVTKWSINFTRIPSPPSSTPGFPVEFTVFGFALGVVVIVAITARKRQSCS